MLNLARDKNPWYSHNKQRFSHPIPLGRVLRNIIDKVKVKRRGSMCRAGHGNGRKIGSNGNLLCFVGTVYLPNLVGFPGKKNKLHWPKLHRIQNKNKKQWSGPGEPAVSYKWTGWVWENTGWSSRLQENYPFFFWGIYRIYYPILIEENRRMWTCNRLDL